MRNIRLTIAYDGTDFKGWQAQAKGERTVQGEILRALEKILGEKVQLIGSGRTDTGVHAHGQTANFKTRSALPVTELRNALNAHLPQDISILKVEDTRTDFHSQYSIKTKTYRYRVLNQAVRHPLYRRDALFYPHTLNLRIMREEAKALIGRHDFKSFQTNSRGTRMEDTVRTLSRLSIVKKGALIEITVTADGFLYKMVRNIVGLLLEIGSGRQPEGSAAAILKRKDRSLLRTSAPAHGLCLLETAYPASEIRKNP